MSNDEIQRLEQEIFERTARLHALRESAERHAVRNYPFATLAGDTTLLDLFGSRDQLFVVHNMGQGCRYCTLWADGFNGILAHLESAFSFVVVSKDAPELQRAFAASRGWGFRMASHGGGDYLKDQSVVPDGGNMPGAVVYEREGSTIYRKNACVFGPGDLYSPMWNLLSLAGIAGGWTPQFRYWQPPVQLDDGGENANE